MKFSDVRSVLAWFFNNRIEKKPFRSKSLDFMKVPGTNKYTDFEKEIEAFRKIRKILNAKLKPKEWLILREEFKVGGKTQADIAQEYHLSGDRSIRKVRDRCLKKLRSHFLEVGLIYVPRYEAPIYDHG